MTSQITPDSISLIISYIDYDVIGIQSLLCANSYYLSCSTDKSVQIALNKLGYRYITNKYGDIYGTQIKNDFKGYEKINFIGGTPIGMEEIKNRKLTLTRSMYDVNFPWYNTSCIWNNIIIQNTYFYNNCKIDKKLIPELLIKLEYGKQYNILHIMPYILNVYGNHELFILFKSLYTKLLTKSININKYPMIEAIYGAFEYKDSEDIISKLFLGDKYEILNILMKRSYFTETTISYNTFRQCLDKNLYSTTIKYLFNMSIEKQNNLTFKRIKLKLTRIIFDAINNKDIEKISTIIDTIYSLIGNKHSSFIFINKDLTELIETIFIYAMDSKYNDMDKIFSYFDLYKKCKFNYVSFIKKYQYHSYSVKILNYALKNKISIPEILSVIDEKNTTLLNMMNFLICM